MLVGGDSVCGSFFFCLLACGSWWKREAARDLLWVRADSKNAEEEEEEVEMGRSDGGDGRRRYE